MSFIEERLLNQTLTYWQKLVPDGFGGYTWTAPVSLPCRWEDRDELIIDPQGDEIRSRARVFVDRDLDIGAYLYLGASAAANPVGVVNAYEIVQTRRIPQLRGPDSNFYVFI